LWESERYFIAFSDVIRQEFSFRSAPDALNQATIGEIQSTESVALHVRRGDKATLTKPAHGVCGLDYYRTAIDLLSARVSKPHFFVFSDDPAWARENIKIKFPCTYLSHNAANQPTEDLRLMSHCQHFIIANSTFSWWGAWLGKNPAKCVIAPKNWFISPSISMQDRIPDRWIQV
jgi:hypothetical protein